MDNKASSFSILSRISSSFACFHGIRKRIQNYLFGNGEVATSPGPRCGIFSLFNLFNCFKPTSSEVVSSSTKRSVQIPSLIQDNLSHEGMRSENIVPDIDQVLAQQRFNTEKMRLQQRFKNYTRDLNRELFDDLWKPILEDNVKQKLAEELEEIDLLRLRIENVTTIEELENLSNEWMEKYSNSNKLQEAVSQFNADFKQAMRESKKKPGCHSEPRYEVVEINLPEKQAPLEEIESLELAVKIAVKKRTDLSEEQKNQLWKNIEAFLNSDASAKRIEDFITNRAGYSERYFLRMGYDRLCEVVETHPFNEPITIKTLIGPQN